MKKYMVKFIGNTTLT